MLTFPKEAITDSQKLEYAMRVLEKLRLWYNETAKTLPPKERKDFFYNQWLPRNKAAHNAISYYKKRLDFGDLLTAVSSELYIATKTAAYKTEVYDKDIDLLKVPRLSIVGEPPDPLEDFTTFTVVDPLGEVGVAANVLTLTDVDEAQQCQVYKDKGTNHYASNFVHSFEYSSNSTSQHKPVWALQQGIGAMYANDAIIGDYCQYEKNASAHATGVRINNSADSDSSIRDDAVDEQRYVDMELDTAVGTYGVLYGRVYSDSAKTTLIDTMAANLEGPLEGFRYLYALNYYIDGPNSWNGNISNMDTRDYFYNGTLKRFDMDTETWKQSKLQVPVAPGWASKRLKRFDAADDTWYRVKADETE